MRFYIRHEIRGRIRVHMDLSRMTIEQADILQYYLDHLSNVKVKKVKIQHRTQDVTILYEGNRDQLIEALRRFHFKEAHAKVPAEYLENSGRELNDTYKTKLVTALTGRAFKRIFLPTPVRTALTAIRSIKYISLGIKTLIHRKIEVPVLDATAITVSMASGDFATAGSIMFLLNIGEILEEWTHKKSVDDLARSMSLHVDKVWMLAEGEEVLTNADQIEKGDLIVGHMGNVIPFDGPVVAGEAMVNQSSLTGESMPVRKTVGSYVYAGTVLEEGELTLQVKETSGSGKFDKIVKMIEESEKMKSSVESKAEHLADRLVPYTLLGSALTGLITGNATKAISVLMVDYSCALKLAMPISVLSAIREAGDYNVTVKGGKFMEAVADADTIVFDKTGTLTKARPTVAKVYAFNGMNSDELLRIAACMEEHFPHSMAKAVVDAAASRGLVHEEMHSKVEYIVAHGISTAIGDHNCIIGSYHFVFEDEKVRIPQGMEDKFHSIPTEYSQLYLAIDGKLAAVICIEDPLREEAEDVIKALKGVGFSKIVMMTGDSHRTAKAIAKKVGVDEYYAEVLPEDKANFVEKEKAADRRVIMVGDGINDSPALSAADVGVAISNGAQIAREIADVTISGDSLDQLVALKQISTGLMRRIHTNYHTIIGINTSLIVLGVLGVLQPATSALFHNTSTIVIGLRSMRRLIG